MGDGWGAVSGFAAPAGGDGGCGVGDPEFVGCAVGHGHQPVEATRDGVLAQRWISKATKLAQRGVPVVQPQGAGRCQMVRGAVTENV